MDEDDDDVPDMDDFAAQGSADKADDAALPAPQYKVANEPEDSFLKTRTYDVSITYDKYYQARPPLFCALARGLLSSFLLESPSSLFLSLFL